MSDSSSTRRWIQIAFQTHLCQNEFHVRAFGLTRALDPFRMPWASPDRHCLVYDILIIAIHLTITWTTSAKCFSVLLQVRGKLNCPSVLSCITLLPTCVMSSLLLAFQETQGIMDWPLPPSVFELYGFLVLASYYMKFVHNFGILLNPLTDLLCKNSLFIWMSLHYMRLSVYWNMPVIQHECWLYLISLSHLTFKPMPFTRLYHHALQPTHPAPQPWTLNLWHEYLGTY